MAAFTINRNTIYITLLSAIAASTPWSTTHPVSIISLVNTKFIGLLVLFFLLDKNLIAKLKTALSNKMVWLWLAMFLLYAIGMLWATDMHSAGITLERKLSFVFLPIILAGEKKILLPLLRIVFTSFVCSLLVAIVYLEICGTINHLHYKLPTWEYLVYESLSRPIMHPGYFSVFIVVAFMATTISAVSKINYTVFSKKVLIFISIVFFIFLTQLISKTVLLFLIIYLPWLAYSVASNMANKATRLLVYITAIVSLVLFVVGGNAMFSYRFVDLINKFSYSNTVRFDESINSRLAAAVESIKCIQLKPILGYGTGSANAILEQQFIIDNYKGLLKPVMHTHNQYTHTALDLGIVGLIVLFLFLSVTIIYFFKNKNNLGVMCTIFLMFCCLTDDVLELHSGIVFFTFIISLLSLAYKHSTFAKVNQ